MKLTKFIFAVMVVVFAVWTLNAQVFPGGRYRFEKVNFSLIVTQQTLKQDQSIASGVWEAKTMRIGNKDLLKYLAEVFHTSWPDGAQLAILSDTEDIYPIYREIYVLDKAGNALSSGNWGYFLNETNNAYFRVNCGLAVKTGNYKNTWPKETYNVTNSQIISFELYRIEDDPSVYTDLKFQGLDTEMYSQRSSYYTNNIFMQERANVSGDGTMNTMRTVVSGHVTIAGHWMDVF